MVLGATPFPKRGCQALVADLLLYLDDWGLLHSGHHRPRVFC